MTIAEIQQEILRMKKEKDICILAHAYQGQEILEVQRCDHVRCSFYGRNLQSSKPGKKSMACKSCCGLSDG